MSPNRVVALLTPLAAPVAGGITAWIANNFPGVEIPRSALEEVFIGGALIALAPAAQWLNGWQKYEARQAETEAAVQIASAGTAVEPAIEPDFEAEEVFEEADHLDALSDLDDFDDFDEFDDELFADEERAPLGV